MMVAKLFYAKSFIKKTSSKCYLTIDEIWYTNTRLKWTLLHFFFKSSMIETMIDCLTSDWKNFKKMGNILRRPENIREGLNKIRPLSHKQLYKELIMHKFLILSFKYI